MLKYLLLKINQSHLILNNKKNDNEMDDKAITLANNLIKAVKESRGFKENLKHLSKIIKKISVCISNKPIR